MKIAIHDASTNWTGTTNYILIESSMSTCAKSITNSALHRNRTILISTRPGWVHIPEVGAGSSYWGMLDRISSTRTTASKFFSFLVLFYLAAKPEILDPLQFLKICGKTWKKKQKNQYIVTEKNRKESHKNCFQGTGITPTERANSARECARIALDRMQRVRDWSSRLLRWGGEEDAAGWWY